MMELLKDNITKPIIIDIYIALGMLNNNIKDTKKCLEEIEMVESMISILKESVINLNISEKTF